MRSVLRPDRSYGFDRMPFSDQRETDKKNAAENDIGYGNINAEDHVIGVLVAFSFGSKSRRGCEHVHTL